MHKDARLPDWATAIAGAGPTWLEIVASHAQLLSAVDDRTDVPTRSASRTPRSTDESRHWMNRIRAELAR